jgi:ketosteroid isomerase-like protein
MIEQTPDAAEQEFFAALVEADVETLGRVLADDFVLIDVMTGSEVPKSALLEVVGGGELQFASIERVEFRVRVYGTAAVVTGRTEMGGVYAGQPFQASSRYTHVFVAEGAGWRMVAAQGTQITPQPVAT